MRCGSVSIYGRGCRRLRQHSRVQQVMADRRETGVVYAAGTVQGVALVTFPAASTIFTSPSYYGLSSTAYGAMFLPQAVTAIASSLLGARLTRSWGIKRVFLIGLIANLSAMLLLLL